MPNQEYPMLTKLGQEQRPLYTLGTNYVQPRLQTLAHATKYISATRYPERSNANSYPERVQTFKAGIKAGVMPPLGNGFRFVVDHRPAGHEADYISAEEYARYFSEGKVPIAAPGHRLHAHDCTHGPNFQTLFANSRFAQLAGNAASNALATGQSEIFTGALDGFSDHMLVLEARFLQYIDNANSELGSVMIAERHLKTLIGLETGTAEHQDALFQTMHVNLGMAQYRQEEVAKAGAPQLPR